MHADSGNELLATMRAERDIRQALLRYFRGADRRDYDLMASAYHTDAHDDHGPYKGNVAGLIAWVQERHRTVDQSMHLAGNSLIEVEGSAAHVETYCVLFQHSRCGQSFATGKPTYKRHMIGVRYIDRFEERGAAWKVANRVVVFEWAQEEVGDLQFGPGWAVARRDSDDFVYRGRGSPQV